jgi:hypothetical protein
MLAPAAALLLVLSSACGGDESVAQGTPTGDGGATSTTTGTGGQGGGGAAQGGGGAAQGGGGAAQGGGGAAQGGGGAAQGGGGAGQGGGGAAQGGGGTAQGGGGTAQGGGGAGGGCVDACNLGEAQCDGNAVRTCELSGGCTVLSAPAPCAGSEVCSGGKCVASCTDQCTDGAKQCSGLQLQACAVQANGCTDWSAPTGCPVNQACTAGVCALTCTDTCSTPGAKQCAGNGTQTCQLQGNGCLGWSATAACPQDQTCSAGACIACVDGAKRCSVNGNAETCAGDTWTQTQACALGCNAGACIDAVTCTPGTHQCKGNAVEICNGSGTAYLYSQTCAVACSGGLCTGACTPDDKRCNGAKVEQCNSDGTAWTTAESCSTYCDDSTRTCALSSLTVKNLTELDGEIVVDGPVVVESGATLNSPTGNLTIRATSITVKSGGSITAAPTGNTPAGAGFTGPNYGCGGTGAGYGALGSYNAQGSSCSTNGTRGPQHGFANDVTVVAGSRGGTGNNYSGAIPGQGGPGGGRLQLIASSIDIAGLVTANGANGSPGVSGSYAGGGGGGSGGGILIAANVLKISGSVSAVGGGGGAGYFYGTAGGAGANGRVKLFYGTTNDVTGTITGTKTHALLPPLTIASTTHPDPSLIYNDDFSTVAVTWNKAFPSVQAYFYRASTTQYQVPTSATGLFVASESVSFDPTKLSAGSNWFHMIPVDQASVEGLAENQFGIQVNATPPAVTSTSHPSQTTWSGNANAVFKWTLPNADENHAGYYYVLDHYGTTVPTKAATFLPVAQKQIILANLADGIWGFHVVSVDQRGYLTKQAGHYKVRIGADPGAGGILGSVVDGSSVSVSGAKVTINRGLLNPGVADQTTPSNGAYNFGSIPVGTWEVQVSKAGFATETQTVTVTQGNSATLNFTLTP